MTEQLQQTAVSHKRPASKTRRVIDADNTHKPAEAAATMDDNNKSLLTTKKKAAKPAYLQSLNESEKQANFKIIDSMNKKISYLKNPRYKVSKAPILMTSAVKDAQDASKGMQNSSFRVEPTSVNFANYQVNGIYEIIVKVTNMAPSSKRIKFIPPSSDVFTVARVKYPDSTTGDVATGMSVTMAVIFQAPSFADFDDAITFVTEENSFKLPLSARRTPPLINLVNPMDCLNSWLGDRVDMAFRCVNTGGDGGFKFFCERDEDDGRQTDQDNIKMGSFTITPCEFYLYSGNAIDVYVSFNPDQEGALTENLILACDNQTSEFYKVAGYGAMLDLDIIAVDGKEVNFKANPFETVFFENTNPTAESKRTISIKNGSPIAVPFHWSIYKEKNSNKISLQDEQTHYRVVPQQGKIKGGETINFEVYFSPDHAEPYFEFADLIIEDVPISAIRSPPEGLKNFAAQNQPKSSKVPMPTYVGSNTQFLSIPMIQFNLRGQGNSCQVEVEPPISFIEGDTFINYDYSRVVKLKKLTQGTVNYKLRMEGQNRNFEIDIIADGKSLKAQPNQLIQGKLSVDHIDLQFKLRSEERGLALAYFYIEIEDGPPVSFQVQADFRGPIVKLSEAIIDIGLSKVNTIQHHELKIENLSPIPADFIIKSSKNKKMTFSNAVMSKNEESQASLRVEKPVVTKHGNNIEFDNYSYTLNPNESFNVNMSVNCLTEETIDEHIEVMVRDSDSMYFEVLGEVQKPKVYLNRESVDLGNIYAGVKEIVDNDVGKNKHQSLELINYGNLPCHFKWEERYEKGVIASSFEPSEGTIPPKSKVRIAFEMTTYIGGQIDELFLCDIQDLELPVGFEVKADAFGLNVAYLTADDQSMLSTQTSFKDDGLDVSQFNGMNQLKMVNFTECRINKPLSKKFLLKNLSGIATTFKFGASDFEPISHVAPSKKSEVQMALEAEAARKKNADKEAAANDNSLGKKKTIRFAASSKMSATNGSDKRNKPILTDEHEATQKFTSASGNTFTQTKVFEKEQNYFLSNNKGIAIVFHPHEGDLPANSEVPITVTIYNNVCGKFDDRLFANVTGLPPVEFPCRININGSPIVIPPNQVGLSYNSIYPTLPLPAVVHNTSSITKTFKIKNTGIRALQVDWKVYSQDSGETTSSDLDIFDLKVAKNTSFDKRKFPYKFNFSAIEPPETTNSAFDVLPKNVSVACRSTQEFKVTFNPNFGLGHFKSIIIASPQLASEELELIQNQEDLPKPGTLGIIAVNLTSQTIAPYLKIDKSIKMDGERHINMKIWSTVDERAPSNISKLIFSNDSKADMVFNFSTQGPFEIVSSVSNTGSKHPLAGQSTPNKIVQKKAETMFCLQPLKIVEIGIKFKAPKPATTEEWPMIMTSDRQGALVASFSNGDSQKFFIEGHLMRPKIVLLTENESKNDYAMDEMDFGVCNVDKKRTIKLFLSNITEVTAKWSLNYVKFSKKITVSKYTTTKWEEENHQKTDDPDVFEFSISTGSLRGKTLPLRKVPEGLCVPPVPKDEDEKQLLPQTILVNFRPKQNVLYKSKFRFTVENGLSCDVILKGKGSYEENHD